MSDEQSKPGPQTAPGERMELPSLNRGRTKKRGGAGPTEDAFQVGVKQVGQKAARRAPLVAIGLVLGIGAIVASVVLYARSQESSAEATRLLTTAVTYEARAEVGDPDLLLGKSDRPPPAPVVKDEAARAAAVDQALAELSAQAKGSEAEVAAEVMVAARRMQEGKFAEAETTYRGFLDTVSAGHPLRWAAREGLGFAREAQGDLDGALAEFKTLAGEKGVFYRDMGLWHQGRVLERQNKTDEALAIYRQYIAEFPLGVPSIAQSEVRKRLAELDPSAVAGTQADAPMQVIDMPLGEAP